MISLLIIFSLFISPIYCEEEEYEIFSQPIVSPGLINQPMISEGIFNPNQTMFEMEEDHERLCGKEGRLLKEKGNLLVQCSSDSECLPPSQCHTTGYCCMIALHQEPPPVGCPIGTRSLRNISGAELTCNPNVPNSCPGGALCYTDSMTNERRCCGSDPGQGCPAGSKAILFGMANTPLLCTPGRTACPNGGLCQWSHLIDRYQCCSPDNGCPRHQTPLKNSAGGAVQCSPGGAPCPNGAGCHFNFWTASYQCCRTDTADLCPAGQVPFLSTVDASPKSCSKDLDCPTGYLCGDNRLCCGQPGSCPAGNTGFKDLYGRLTACSARQGNTCPDTSSCMDVSSPGQKLCCTQEDYICPGFSVPVPSAVNPLKCNIGQPNSCPEGICMPSNFKGINICCRSTVIAPPSPIQVVLNPCPTGWALQDNEITYCQPQAEYTTCPGFSSCIRSAVIANQFVCCIPGRLTAPAERCLKSGSRPELLSNRSPRRCKNGNHQQCSKGFTCQPTIRNGWLCCSVPRAQAQNGISLSCPQSNLVPVIGVDGGNQMCNSPGGMCANNALCLAALSPRQNVFICCTFVGGGGTVTCQNNAAPQTSINGFVDCSFNPNLCLSGYTCQTATDGVSRICCQESTAACPSNAPIYRDTNGNPRYCLPAQPAACPATYSCQAALSPSGSFVCCATPGTATCPANYQPDLTNVGQNIFCDRSQPAGCPSGSVCLQDPLTRQSLCCRPSASTTLCPNGQQALLDGRGGIQLCTGPGTVCPAVGYSCLFSNSFGQYICCGSAQANAVCADGRQTFTQTSGSTYTCNPLSPTTGCPFNYDCAPSNQIGVSVCCLSSGTTITPPTNVFQCPNGWNPFRNPSNQLVQYCSSTTDRSCPPGYSCTPSSQPAIYLCCRLADSPTCLIGTTYFSNGLPKMCSRNIANQCPRGYVCQQSTSASISLCCSTQLDATVLCPDNSPPAMIGPNIRFCPVLNSNAGCPGGYTCQLSNQATNVCCASSFSSLRLSPSTSSVFKCPNGVVPSISQQSCSSNGDCPIDSTCYRANNVAMCCASSVPPDTRCKARRTLLNLEKPVECLPGSNCPLGYECSFETNNHRTVCCESPERAQEICPENRATFLIQRTEEPMYCDSTAFICANGQECVQSRDGSRHVCCSPMAHCPPGTSKPFGQTYPIRCFTSEGCSADQSCVSSTVDDVRVCCNVLYRDAAKKTKDDEDWVVVEGK